MNAIVIWWEDAAHDPCGDVLTAAANIACVEYMHAVLEHTYTILCTAIATEVGISPASVFVPYHYQTPGEVELCTF